MRYSLLDYDFQEISSIIPEIDENGVPIEYNPKSDYNNTDNRPIHAYGNGPFCRFGIPAFLHKTGVYVILLDDKPTYVGECEDLAKRWNMGYGNISPRNCFTGGQPTNCRINSLILCSYKAGSKINLIFFQTNNRFEIERDLITKLEPEWNRSNGKASNNERIRIKNNETLKNKYQKLADYLRNSENSVERLSYQQIEEVVGNTLPLSAYRYRPW